MSKATGLGSPPPRIVSIVEGNCVDYEVVIDFDAWATDLVRGRKWHASQQFQELPDGCAVILRVKTSQ